MKMGRSNRGYRTFWDKVLDRPDEATRNYKENMKNKSDTVVINLSKQSITPNLKGK